MYVLVISRGIPSEKYKMNGIFEFDQAKALAKVGCQVVYAAVDVRSIRRWRKWGIESHKIDGVYVYGINIPGGRLPKVILHSISTLGLNILYNHVFKEFGKPDILHAHFPDMSYIASLLKKRINTPLVTTEHFSQLLKPLINNSIYHTAKKAYSNADAIIAVSPTLAQVIENKFGIQAKYVPNIVDTEIFNHNTIKNNKDGVYQFISVGNLIYRKRMDLIIEAFYKSFYSNPNVTLTIFGEGRERSKIESLINRYNIHDQVKLMGMQSRTTIANALQRSDCFVLPSRFETFGVGYIEALATGVPVISTKCGGPECFINEGNGLLIPVDDEKALIEAMQYMYKYSDSFHSMEISTEIKSKFSPESVARQIVAIYEEILQCEGNNEYYT